MACGHQCITCSPPLVRTRTLDDSYLDKEEPFCQETQAAIRREQYSVWKNRRDKNDCSFFEPTLKLNVVWGLLIIYTLQADFFTCLFLLFMNSFYTYKT